MSLFVEYLPQLFIDTKCREFCNPTASLELRHDDLGTMMFD